MFVSNTQGLARSMGKALKQKGLHAKHPKSGQKRIPQRGFTCHEDYQHGSLKGVQTIQVRFRAVPNLDEVADLIPELQSLIKSKGGVVPDGQDDHLIQLENGDFIANFMPGYALPILDLGSNFKREVFERIDADRELLAETCLELGNTYGPCGHEQPVADAVSAWYERHGVPARQQSILADRSNVVATLAGTGGGRSLIFNAHLDTEISGHDHDNLMESDDPNRVGAWREGDRIFGHTVLNDRGCMSVFMVVAKALRSAGAALSGDVIFTSVAGETGMAPVDEYRGLSYEGKGFGTRHLVDHGVRADYALVAETTAWSMSWIECGAVYLKITLRGRNMYTPRLIRSPELADHPNAIVKGAAVATALEAWGIDYEERNSYVSELGEVRPKAQVGAIRGGVPYRPNRSSPVCKLYMDVRTPPGTSQDAVIVEVREVARSVDPAAEVECYMAKAGLQGTGVEPLAAAVEGAYGEVVGGHTPPPQVAHTSMWRDTNVFNAVGIPSLTFGPPRGSAAVQGTGHFELDDLVAAAKVYAAVAIDLCA